MTKTTDKPANPVGFPKPVQILCSKFDIEEHYLMHLGVICTTKGTTDDTVHFLALETTMEFDRKTSDFIHVVDKKLWDAARKSETKALETTEVDSTKDESAAATVNATSSSILQSLINKK